MSGGTILTIEETKDNLEHMNTIKLGAFAVGVAAKYFRASIQALFLLYVFEGTEVIEVRAFLLVVILWILFFGD